MKVQEFLDIHSKQSLEEAHLNGYEYLPKDYVQRLKIHSKGTMEATWSVLCMAQEYALLWWILRMPGVLTANELRKVYVDVVADTESASGASLLTHATSPVVLKSFTVARRYSRGEATDAELHEAELQAQELLKDVTYGTTWDVQHDLAILVAWLCSKDPHQFAVVGAIFASVDKTCPTTVKSTDGRSLQDIKDRAERYALMAQLNVIQKLPNPFQQKD